MKKVKIKLNDIERRIFLRLTKSSYALSLNCCHFQSICAISLNVKTQYF